MSATESLSVSATGDAPAPAVLGTERDRHLASCSPCMRRWERAVSLQGLKSRLAPGSVDPASFAPVRYTSMLCPLGIVWIACGSHGVPAIDINSDELLFCMGVEQLTGKTPEYTTAGLDDIVQQVEEYFAGRRTAFEVVVDLGKLRPFQRAVLQAVMEVPYGSVQSYRDIAQAIGRPRGARAVGTAVAACPLSLVVPCHRIIRSDGTLGGYGHSAGGCSAEQKRLLLALEGVVFGAETSNGAARQSTRDGARSDAAHFRRIH